MQRVLIIAEAGVNHNGDMILAHELVKAGARAGADIVKFQTFRAASLATKRASRAEYQKVRAPEEGDSQLALLSALEIPFGEHRRLVEACRDAGVEFLSTAFDEQSVEFLADLNLPFWKVPSGEITNIPFLRRIGGSGKRIILSTGMSSLGEVETALNVLGEAGTPRDLVTILHCTSEYPAAFSGVNLRAMVTLRDAFKVNVGYSDHTPGIEMSLAAVALGATIIEKHFTLDRSLPGVDQASSLQPDEFAQMVKAIRNIEEGLGDGIKRPTTDELKTRVVARKSIIARVAIRTGDIFSPANLTVKRPGDMLSAARWDEVLGRVAGRDFQPDEAIEW